MYARYFNIDEWVYVGYGYSYLDPTFNVTDYKIGRLPWILLEGIVRGSFSRLVSSWILAFGVLALGNIALFFALRIPFGRLPALSASIFIAGLTFMYANGGPDYHNTLAGAFYCLSMFLCARCARRQPPGRDLVFLGAVLALTVHTNPVFINLVPILIVQFLLSYRVNHLEFPALFPTIFLGMFGAVAVTVLLGVVNFSCGRQFFFFAQQLHLIIDFVSDSSRQKTWWEPWSRWYLNAPNMGFFFAGALLSFTTLALAAPWHSAPAVSKNASLYSGAYLFALFIWTVWQSVGQTAFQPYYFAFPLGFPLAGAVAAAIATSVRQTPSALPLTVAMVFFAAMTIAGVYYCDHVVSFFGATFWPPGVEAAMGFTMAFAALVSLRWSMGFGFLAIMILCAADGLAVSDPLAYAASNCSVYRDRYELILDASRMLRETHFAGTKVFVFSEFGDNTDTGPDCGERQIPAGWLQAAIGATGFEEVEHYWANKTLDRVEPERWREVVAAKGLVGFITGNPTRISVLREKLEEAGGMPGATRFFRLKKGNVELPLYILPLS
ncbi:MAG: hypothetical protein JO216_10595 [Hyphomicrobiales bacterium]|nr:hypothetical protein [Hyphomicrobiales bacterium]